MLQELAKVIAATKVNLGLLNRRQKDVHVLVSSAG
jgi:hypothetical protein